MGCAQSAASLDLHQFDFNCVGLTPWLQSCPADSEERSFRLQRLN